MNLHDGNVIVIPNGLNIKKFLEIDDLIWGIIEQYNLTKYYPLILSPVNILERKNLDYSIDIIYHLKKTYPNICYIITGKTSKHHSTLNYYNNLKKKVADLSLTKNVIFFNDFLNRALVRSEIHDLYQLSDLVFFFSLSENFGLPLLEASLTKTPIFVSNLKVFREVGGDFIKYLDYKIIPAQDAATAVKDFLEKSLRVKMNYHSRRTYELKAILKQKF